MLDRLPPSLYEVVLCATAPSSSSAGLGVISIHDIQTGSALASFKQTSAAVHCTAVVQSDNAQGGFMLAAQPDKSILNVYNFQKDQLVLKMVLPERLSCLAVDRRGEFCAGGTAQGRIYLWEVPSGIMYGAWDAHYRQVTVLRFTHDGSALLSGSDDSGISVWSMSRLLDEELQNELPMQYCTFSDHTLSISDIKCGVGAFPQCRVLTSSIDHSVKLWDLSTRDHSLLTTFQFPKAISCLAWDPSERFFFAAAQDDEGSVYRMNLFRQGEADVGAQAVGGAVPQEVVRVDDEMLKQKRLILAGSQVTCLAISTTSSFLLVGTATGSVQIYDITSQQHLRSITIHKDKGLRITSLAAILKPLDLIGHVSLSLSVNEKGGCKIVPRPVVPFMKMKDAKARQEKEIWMLDSSSIDSCDPYRPSSPSSSLLRRTILREQAFFLRGQSSAPAASSVQSLQSEVDSLRSQLGKAKALNDTMWELIVRRALLADKQEVSGGGSGGEGNADGDRPRKRGRTRPDAPSEAP